MPMDWSNERYVRVYTRDTADWLALSTDAQDLLLLLLRRLRIGVDSATASAQPIAVLPGRRVAPVVPLRLRVVSLAGGVARVPIGGVARELGV